jgi:predicted DsbA family dithiol-disulfide isomerase
MRNGVVTVVFVLILLGFWSTTITSAENIAGAASAKVTIIEYGDFQCPFCGSVEPTVKQIMKDYDGKVKLQFKHYPFSFHQYAQKAAEAAECAADQGKFWEMHDLLLANQNSLSVDNLKAYAQSLGLNTVAFNSCLDNSLKEDIVKKDMDSGVAAGVQATPTFFINGKIISGAQPYGSFKTVIDSVLAVAGDTVQTNTVSSTSTTATTTSVTSVSTCQKYDTETISQKKASCSAAGGTFNIKTDDKGCQYLDCYTATAAATSSSASAVASCTIDESLQKQINELLAKLQDAEKSGDTQLMTDIKQKISSLGQEMDRQKAKCTAKTTTTTAVTMVTTATTTETKEVPVGVIKTVPSEVPSTSTKAGYTTNISSCVSESLQTQLKELMTQLQNAVDNNNTEQITQIGQKIEPLGMEVLTQMKEGQCYSGGAGGISLSLFCPVEAGYYAMIEKQLNSLKAQEYQARTNGNTELALQLQQKIAATTNESAKWSEKCQAKLLENDLAKYFMSSYSTAKVVVQNGTSPVTTAIPTIMTTAANATAAQNQAAGSICYVPYDLEKSLKEAWNDYYSFVKGNETDMTKIAEIKGRISKYEGTVNDIKENCQPPSGQPVAVQVTTVAQQPINATTGGQGVTGIPVQTTVPGQAIRPGENCTVPVELTQQFEGLWKNYKEAIASNDTKTAEEIKTKIAEIEKKLSEAKGQCVKTIVTENAGAGDVVSYYKEKVTAIMTQEQNTDAQISQLKQLKEEIDNLIIDLIKRKSRFNASEVSTLVKEIKVSPTEIMAGTATVATANASITTQIMKKDIEVRQYENKLAIHEGNVTANVAEVSIEDNKVKVGGVEVKVSPAEAVSKANVKSSAEINLTTENSKLIYNVKGTEKRNLLMVIPVTIETATKIDAENGSITNEQKPWWTFLTTS